MKVALLYRSGRPSPVRQIYPYPVAFLSDGLHLPVTVAIRMCPKTTNFLSYRKPFDHDWLEYTMVELGNVQKQSGSIFTLCT
jgi:hypothetical protein